MPRVHIIYNEYHRNYLPKDESLRTKNQTLFLLYLWAKIFTVSQIALLPWYWMQWSIINDEHDFESHHLYIVNEFIRVIAWYCMIVYVFISTWDTYCYSVIGATCLSFRQDEQDKQEQRGQQGFLIQDYLPQQQVDIFPKRMISKTIGSICLVIQTISIMGMSLSYWSYANGTFRELNVRLLCGCHMFECHHSIYSLYKFVLVCFPMNGSQ